MCYIQYKNTIAEGLTAHRNAVPSDRHLLTFAQPQHSHLHWKHWSLAPARPNRSAAALHRIRINTNVVIAKPYWWWWAYSIHWIYGACTSMANRALNNLRAVPNEKQYHSCNSLSLIQCVLNASRLPFCHTFNKCLCVTWLFKKFAAQGTHTIWCRSNVFTINYHTRFTCWGMIEFEW